MREEMFNEFMEFIEFALIKNKDNTFSVDDIQGANLGNIEEDRFNNASDLIERLDVYVDDYFIKDVENVEKDYCFNKRDSVYNWHSISEYIDYLKGTELYDDNSSYCCKWDIDVLDMVYNHASEIDLNKCFYETREEKLS